MSALSFPSGDQKAAINRRAKACQTQDINNTNDPQKSITLERPVKNVLLEGLNRAKIWYEICAHISKKCGQSLEVACTKTGGFMVFVGLWFLWFYVREHTMS